MSCVRGCTAALKRPFPSRRVKRFVPSAIARDRHWPPRLCLKSFSARQQRKRWKIGCTLRAPHLLDVEVAQVIRSSAATTPTEATSCMILTTVSCRRDASDDDGTFLSNLIQG